MTVAGYQPKDAIGRDTFVLNWGFYQLSAGARDLWMGIPTYTSLFGSMTGPIEASHWTMPMAATIEGWAVYQRQANGAYVNQVTCTFQRAYGTVNLDSFLHVIGAVSTVRAVNVSIVAGDTLAIKVTDPGQGVVAPIYMYGQAWGVWA